MDSSPLACSGTRPAAFDEPPQAFDNHEIEVPTLAKDTSPLFIGSQSRERLRPVSLIASEKSFRARRPLRHANCRFRAGSR